MNTQHVGLLSLSLLSSLPCLEELEIRTERDDNDGFGIDER